ncbi:DEAD/DEAH box helicase [Patescibacteria group bacterium]
MEQLPVKGYLPEILASDSQYVIVEAETGSGKTVLVPQAFHAAGMRVLVTEPLIETVIGTSEYVAEMMGVRFGSKVGYRTGASRCDSPDTEILFCTDGLALVRELAGHNRFDVLVIDELHEWNKNQSTLEAWAWKHLQEGTSPFQKIVVLSATLDSERLSRKRGNAPIFKVPGRQFPIEDRDAGYSIESDIRDMVEAGHDVLCFQPGKKEIEATISGLNGLDAELIPFHSQLERSEKNRAYRSYDRPKVIVSTNSLETGRTVLPSEGRLLAVVDSGMEKRIEHRDGIEGLYLSPIAKARGKQRRGRTGRVGNGIYINHCPTDDRPEFPVPEILRTRLDQTVLRLAVAGYDASELPFFHDLNSEEIARAKKSLFALGAMDSDGKVLKIGRTMARLPLSVQFSRMIVEAQKLNVVDDVVTIAAILETGSIRDRTHAWRAFTEETESDLLAELDLWKAGKGKKAKELPEMGIFKKAYFRASDLRRKLTDALRKQVRFGSSGNREMIKRACVAGMVDHLYQSQGWDEYRNGDNGDRKKARESVVTDRPEWIVGLPKDIQFKNRRGYICTLNLVTMVTAVDPTWLADVAPQLVRTETGINPNYNRDTDTIDSTTHIFFNDQLIKKENVPTPHHESGPKVFANAFASGKIADTDSILKANKEIRQFANSLHTKSGGTTTDITTTNEVALYTKTFTEHKISSAASLLEALQSEIFTAHDLVLNVRDFVSEAEQIKAEADNPIKVKIDETEIELSYSKSWSSFSVNGTVTEELARSTTAEKIEIPSGRTVTIICESHSANTFSELVQKLEDARIAEAWKEARKEHETPNWIRDPEDVFPHLPKILTEINITRTENGDGEMITGYLSLHSDSDPDFMIKIRGTLDEAREETTTGLKRLVQKACHKSLTIPRETPWQKESGGWYSSWELTDLGNALKTRFEKLAEAHIADLSDKSVEDVIETVRAEAEEIKVEIGGQHIETQNLLQKSEKYTEERIYAVHDEFVESEIRAARATIEKAKELLSSGAYDECVEICDRVKTDADALAGLCLTRSAAKEKASSAQNEVSDNLYNLRYGHEEEADSEECELAETLDEAISEAFRGNRFDEVLTKAEEARELIKKIHDRKAAIEARREAARANAAERLFPYLETHYGTCPVCGEKLSWNLRVVEDAIEGHDCSSIPCYCENKQGQAMIRTLDSGYTGETISHANRETTVLRKTINSSEETVMAIVCYYKYGNWNIDLVVNADRDISDTTTWTTEDVWKQPTETELRLSALRTLRQDYAHRQESAEEEVRDRRAFILTFEEGEHQGQSQLYCWNKRLRTRFVMDRNADAKAEIPYYCYETRTLVDSRNFKVIAVEPFLEYFNDLDQLDEEIAYLERKLETADTTDPESTPEPPAPKTEPEAPKEEAPPKEQASLDALKALQNKFRK